MSSHFLRLTGDVIPRLRAESGEQWNHLSDHPAYCSICLNLESMTARTFLGRTDIEYDNSITLSNDAEKFEHARLKADLATQENLRDFEARFESWSFAAAATDILESANQGCQTCNMFVVCINKLFEDDAIFSDGLHELLVTFRQGYALRCALRQWAAQEEATPDQEEDDFVGAFMATEASNKWSLDHDARYLPAFEIFTASDNVSPWSAIGCNLSAIDPSSEYWRGGHARNVDADPSSNQTIALIRAWIGDCSSTHRHCKPMCAARLPTRVVDVGCAEDFTDVKLFLSGSYHAQYTALSHCWGLLQPLTTINASLGAHLSQIPWSKLPQTFQDAIRLTRSLGFRYIWIDSLCIIQDDSMDWQREAATMADVYQGASLVIAATGSKDGNGGCLFSRSPSTTIDGIDQNGKPFNVYTRRRIDHDISGWGVRRLRAGQSGVLEGEMRNLSSKPLFTRAWCFQERHLGRRVLHFTKNELIWECLTCSNCECGTVQDYALDPILDTKQYVAGLPGTSQTDKERFVDWCNLVIQFSKKSITYASDTLPAISALASRFDRPFTGAYLAGLWENDLHSSMLWKPIRGTKRARFLTDEYIAPSWSWASSDYPVEWIWTSKSARYYFDIIEAHCSQISPDVYGKLDAGFIILSATLVEATLTNDTTIYECAVTYNNTPYNCLDDPGRCKELTDRTVYCLKYRLDIVNTRADSGNDRALILRRVVNLEHIARHGVETYERIGCMEFCPDKDTSSDSDAWEAATDRRKIVIV